MNFEGCPSDRTNAKRKRVWIMTRDEKSYHFVEPGQSQQRTVIFLEPGHSWDYRSIECLDNAGCTLLQPKEGSNRFRE